MYLHENKNNFKDLIDEIAHATGRTGIVIEKDYYVTMILKLLSLKAKNCVFKGGTSLSKGFHVINRFSEDIDITFNEHIGESRRKHLKNTVLKGISEELSMPISNWEKTQSDRDYNAYLFSYESVYGLSDERLPQAVKLETALGSYAFPTQQVTIGNYAADYLESIDRYDIAVQYGLLPFGMNLQSVNRTYIDKIFALCDYYLQKRSARCSRHLYDIYKLTPLISFDEDFEKLYLEVKKHRSAMKICPSAKPGTDVGKIIREFCEDSFYQADYEIITAYFAEDYVDYHDTIKQMRKIAFWIDGKVKDEDALE